MQVFEDPFDPTDPTFPCQVDRISGPLSPADHENLINHNLNINILPIGDGVLISDRDDAPVTNSIDSWVFRFFSLLIVNFCDL
ncbi:hypothetical protein C0989_010929 [Termitomyces sp. Mn162]|nr:hypothetical protein C0989_010929 [Termitomyces sp. Mn162]